MDRKLLLLPMLFVLVLAAGVQSKTVISLIDEDLDLPWQLEDTAEKVDAPLVLLAPPMVAGEGADGQNHTVVKVLNKYGIAELQFLAYPTSVTGGVNVCTGPVYAPQQAIVTCPISDTSTRLLRVFNRQGELLNSFEPSSSITEPFVIAVGNFLSTHYGHEIAIASADQESANRSILFYDGQGQLLQTSPSPNSYPGYTDILIMSTVPSEAGLDDLLLYYQTQKKGCLLTPSSGAIASYSLPSLPTDSGLYPSAFEDELFVSGKPESLVSTLSIVDTQENISTVDAGARENKFWVHQIRMSSGEPVYTFDEYMEGWWIIPGTAITYQENGKLVLRYVDATPFDPYLVGPPENYDADVLSEFAMSVNVTGAPAGTFPASVFWFNPDGDLGIAHFTLQNGSQTVRMNLSANHDPAQLDHTGIIEYFRVDIPNGGLTYAQAQNMRVEIDWISMSDDPFFVPTQGTNTWSDYVRPGLFRFMSPQDSSPGYAGTDFDNETLEYWVGGDFDDYIENMQSDYTYNLPSVWEPMHTHRQHVGPFEHWKTEIDPCTALPRFAALTRLNNTAVYEEIGNEFDVMTWSPGVGPIERLIIWPMRKFLHRLCGRFRGSDGMPEKMISLQPNHEFEISIPTDDSIGDYNPSMIDGFYQHLRKLYNSHSKINSRFGTSFVDGDDFDPPRNLGRGSWDTYLASNDFLMAWIEYGRKIILWRIMQGWRESLLAGFPPELLKCHQIPADYAVGAPETNGGRITPIDWTLTTGTGYGGTRYGIWYNKTYNWIQGAFSSGQSNTTIGEYHPLTTSQSAADNQMLYLFNNGVNFIHHMTWENDQYNEVGRNAYLTMLDDDNPRPGTAGGIASIKPAHNTAPGYPDTRFNIVQLGTGSDRRGLLKSVNADGS